MLPGERFNGKECFFQKGANVIVARVLVIKEKVLGESFKKKSVRKKLFLSGAYAELPT